MVFQVHVDLFDQLSLMGTVGIQPKHRCHAGVSGARDCQFHPIANGGVFDLAHSPNVALFDVLTEQDLARGQVHDARFAIFCCFKGFVVRAVLLGLLRHQAHVGNCSHGGGIKLTIGFTEVDGLLVNTSKRALWNHCLGVLWFAISIPHLATNSDHGGHGCVHDHVVGRMQVRDPFGRVHHRQGRTVGFTSL